MYREAGQLKASYQTDELRSSRSGRTGSRSRSSAVAFVAIPVVVMPAMVLTGKH